MGYPLIIVSYNKHIFFKMIYSKRDFFHLGPTLSSPVLSKTPIKAYNSKLIGANIK